MAAKLLRFVMLACGALLTGLAAAGEYRAEYTTVAGCCGPDLNQDGENGNVSNGQGKGTLGPFKEHAVLDFDFAGIQAATPEQCENPANSIVIPIIAGSGVYRFRDGSLLFRNLAQDGRESFSCFDFVAQRPTRSVVHYTIEGGTGRFDGAVGTSDLDCSFPGVLQGLLVINCKAVGQIARARP